jgi:hypothetical protein
VERGWVFLCEALGGAKAWQGRTTEGWKKAVGKVGKANTSRIVHNKESHVVLCEEGYYFTVLGVGA